MNVYLLNIVVFGFLAGFWSGDGLPNRIFKWVSMLMLVANVVAYVKGF